MTEKRSSCISLVERLLQCGTDNFMELVQIAGLDPETDFRFADLEGIDFGEADLRGYDFTGANLEYSDLSRAIFDPGLAQQAKLRGAKLLKDRQPLGIFKVFVGSTFKDLHEHRKAVQGAINRRDDCKAVVMEEFGARAGRPKEVSLEIVGACDVYLGMIGHCYGYVPDGEAVSVTEAEYDAAVEKGLPRLLFLADERFTAPAHIRETDEQYRKLQKFRARLIQSEVIQSFDNDPAPLVARVHEALSRLIARHGAHPPEASISPPVFLPKRGLCVGREDEVARVCAAVLAEEPEPVAVLGPPGIGKSKVTIAALHDPEVKARYGERRWFVRLETAPEASAILGQVALAIGVPPGPDLDAWVLSALAARPGLLVLDNTETPWWRDAAGTEAVLETLARVPGLALVCSVRGQRAPHRPEWGTTILVQGLAEPAARELFLRRAGERHAASEILPSLLTELDGVPLAIELLAAQVRADEASLERVAKTWREKRSELLTSRPGAEHRTDSFEVSQALSLASPRMTQAARRLYAMMGRLPAGLRWEWAEALLPDEGYAAAEALSELGLAFDAGNRLCMLAPVRMHAADEDLSEVLRGRLSAHWLGLAREQGPKVGGPEGAEAAMLLATEWANLESAFDLALPEAPARAIDAAASLTKLVRMTGLGSSRMLRDAEHAARADGDTRRAAIANEALGDIALERSDHEGAHQRYGMALPLYRQVGDVLGEANCIRSLGDIALRRSDYEGARRRYEQVLPLYRQVGSVLGEANCIRSLGDIALARSEHDGAQQRYEQALPLYRQVGAVLGEANCIQSLGDIALAGGDAGLAYERFGEALTLYRRIEEPYSIGWGLVRLARLAQGVARAERVAEARAAWEAIDRPDLVAELEREFGAGGEG